MRIKNVIPGQRYLFGDFLFFDVLMNNRYVVVYISDRLKGAG